MVESVPTIMSPSDSDEELSGINKLRRRHKTKPFVYVLTMLSAIGGFLFGYDTGVVSGAMLLIRDQFQLNDVWHEAIVSSTIAAAWLFSLLGGFLADLLGRKPVILVSSFVFTCGAVVMGVANTKEVLLVGRIIVGMGIGLMSCSVPLYISEASNSALRGKLVSFYIIMIGGGQFLASTVAALCSTAGHLTGWRYMLGLSGIPALIQFFGFLGMPESPRWLVKKGQLARATTVLRTIRSDDSDVELEVEAIRQSCEESEEVNVNKSGVLMEIIRTPSVYRALILGCSLQMFQQLAGINTVMYYSAMIIQMAGYSDATTAIWMSAMTASINFLCTFVGLFLVERMGRRPLTLSSLLGVTVSLVLLAAGFQLSTVYAPGVTYPEVNGTWPCDSYLSCGDCSNNKDCGFCYLSINDSVVDGSCAAVFSSDDTSHSLYGRCNGTDTSVANGGTLEWAVGYCPSRFQLMPIFGLCFYLFFFAPGMGPMPWTINSEIYPLWARSTCYAISTSVNWFFNLIVSATFLSLIDALTKYGAFYFYAGLALIGLVLLFLTLPETRGKTLEQVEGLFAQPCVCGVRRNSAGSILGGGMVGSAAMTNDRTVQYVHIRGLNTRDRQDSNESGDDT